MLAQLTSVASPPALFPGSGTLANDAIAVNLAADPTVKRGLILVNGEFGERLCAQARRVGLRFEAVTWPWGQPWDLDRVADALERGQPDWVWGVHCESSTGVLNDVAGLMRLARPRGVRVCLDCVSSLGGVPLDLRGVHLASAASGKCLGAHAGLAIVLADSAARTARHGVPSTFDLSAVARTRGPRQTVAWGLLASLAMALEDYRTPEAAAARYAAQAALGRYVRSALARLGVTPLAPESVASPVLTTFRPPAGSPEEFALLCRAFGYEINAWSDYLAQRGLVQIATMGDISARQLDGLFNQLEVWLRHLCAANVA
jgi:aspartate aminotransferase-like enzyme